MEKKKNDAAIARTIDDGLILGGLTSARRLVMLLMALCFWMNAMGQQENGSVDLTKATIVYQAGDAPLVKHMVRGLA